MSGHSTSNCSRATQQFRVYRRHRSHYTRPSGQVRRPQLLDLFCGAGIGADGYADAGFEVTGVDLVPQVEYPYKFIEDDALALLNTSLPEAFDAIHASPPCQAFSRAGTLRKAQGGKASSGDLLTPVLHMLRTRWSHKTWVVENVPGAPGMSGAIELCGSSFKLGVRRHRLFLSNHPLRARPCAHARQGRPWGVYHVPDDRIPHGGRTARDAAHGRAVMQVERSVSWNGLKEGIPPAYTKWIGDQLLKRSRWP